MLGVAPDAPPDQIRAAYRERARLHHPDRAANVGADAMSNVNEAYRILSDPARRLDYDRSIGRRRAGSHGSAAGHATRHGGRSGGDVDSEIDGDIEFDDDRMSSTRVPPSRLMPSGPARVPWRMMAVMAVIGSAAILVTSVFNDPPSDEVPDGILRIGSCVAIDDAALAREVACTGEDDMVVEYLVPTDATCPGGLGAFRDRLGLGTACIELD